MENCKTNQSAKKPSEGQFLDAAPIELANIQRWNNVSHNQRNVQAYNKKYEHIPKMMKDMSYKIQHQDLIHISFVTVTNQRKLQCPLLQFWLQFSKLLSFAQNHRHHHHCHYHRHHHHDLCLTGRIWRHMRVIKASVLLRLDPPYFGLGGWWLNNDDEGGWMDGPILYWMGMMMMI